MSSSSLSKPPPTRKTRRKFTKEQLEQIIHEHSVLGKKPKQISRELDISVSTVQRTINTWETTGNVTKENTNGGWKGAPPKMKEDVYDYLKAMRDLGQHLTIEQVQARLGDSFGVAPSTTTLQRTLKDLGYDMKSRRHSSESAASHSSDTSSASRASTASSVPPA